MLRDRAVLVFSRDLIVNARLFRRSLNGRARVTFANIFDAFTGAESGQDSVRVAARAELKIRQEFRDKLRPLSG